MDTLRVSMPDLIQNVEFWNSHYSLGLTGPWQKSDTIIWGVENCIIVSRKISESLSEWELKPFRKAPSDNDCRTGNIFMERCKSYGWTSIFDYIDIKKMKIEYDVKKAAIEKFKTDPDYERGWRARIYEYEIPGLPEDQKQRQVEEAWKCHLGIMDQMIGEQDKWSLRDDMTTKQAAEEYFEQIPDIEEKQTTEQQEQQTKRSEEAPNEPENLPLPEPKQKGRYRLTEDEIKFRKKIVTLVSAKSG